MTLIVLIAPPPVTVQVIVQTYVVRGRRGVEVRVALTTVLLRITTAPITAVETNSLVELFAIVMVGLEQVSPAAITLVKSQEQSSRSPTSISS